MYRKILTYSVLAIAGIFVCAQAALAGPISQNLWILSGTTLKPAVSTWTIGGTVNPTGNSDYGGFNIADVGTLTAAKVVATSTTATSTVATGGFTVGTNQFLVQQTSGLVGIGSTTPFARFSIHANPTDSTIPVTLFAISSSTGAFASTTLFSVDNVGNIVTRGVVPTVSSCGTNSITATSTDYRGEISVTAGTPTTCNVTFSSPKSDTPICLVGDNSLTLVADITAASSSGFQVGLTAAFSGHIRYVCVQ